jgi:hypothetical protein
MIEQDKAAAVAEEIAERNKRRAQHISSEISWEKAHQGEKHEYLDKHLEMFESNINQQKDIAESKLKGYDDVRYEERMVSVCKQEDCLSRFQKERAGRGGHDEGAGNRGMDEKTIDRSSGMEKEPPSKHTSSTPKAQSVNEKSNQTQIPKDTKRIVSKQDHEEEQEKESKEQEYERER